MLGRRKVDGASVPMLVSRVETMKQKVEEERRMAHGVGGLARRTGLVG